MPAAGGFCVHLHTGCVCCKAHRNSLLETRTRWVPGTDVSHFLVDDFFFEEDFLELLDFALDAFEFVADPAATSLFNAVT